MIVEMTFYETIGVGRGPVGLEPIFRAIESMDLNTLPTYRMEHLDEHFRAVIKRILPVLYDFRLHHNSGRFVNIDFYFEDDPRRDEVGYTGCGLNEFVAGSPTSEALITITRLLEYAFGLKWDD